MSEASATGTGTRTKQTTGALWNFQEGKTALEYLLYGGQVVAVPGQLDEGRHLIQDAGRIWWLLLRLHLRLILRAQLVFDALAELSVPAPVDGPQDLAEARVVVPCHRAVKLVTVHPVWHGTRS